MPILPREEYLQLFDMMEGKLNYYLDMDPIAQIQELAKLSNEELVEMHDNDYMLCAPDVSEEDYNLWLQRKNMLISNMEAAMVSRFKYAVKHNNGQLEA